MNTHSIALMMLGMAIGGSVATTVLCLCAAARCQDCRFRFGPEWPDDLPLGGAQPSVYTPPTHPQPEPTSSPAPAAFPDSSPLVLGEQVDGTTQAGSGATRDSRAGLGGLSPVGAACIDCGRMVSMTLSGLCLACSGRRKL